MGKFSDRQDEDVRRALHDIEVEQALLGSFLVDNSKIRVAAAFCEPEDFFDPIHRALCELIFEFDDDGKMVTPLTVNAWAKHWSGMQELGGIAYLSNLAQAAPALSNVADLASITAELAIRRRALTAIDDAANNLHTTSSVLDAMAPVVEATDAIEARIESVRGGGDLGEAGYNLLRRIETQARDPETYGCPTGITALDEAIGGLIPGNLIILGGRPGMGKSIAGTTFARAAAEAGWEPDYWSLEMSEDELAARLICDIDYNEAIDQGLKPLTYDWLVRLKAREGTMERCVQATMKMRDLGIKVFDHDTVPLRRIAAVTRARTAAARLRGRKKLAIIDHGGLIELDSRYEGRKVDEISELTRGLKRLAKRLMIPVVCLWQLNRDVEKRVDKHPNIADYRDSGSIEQDADVLISLFRPLYYAQRAIREARGDVERNKAIGEYDASNGVLELEVHKNRSGEAGQAPFKCFIDPGSAAIRDEKPEQTRNVTSQLAINR